MSYTRPIYIIRAGDYTTIRHSLFYANITKNALMGYPHHYARVSMEVREIAAAHGQMFGAHVHTYRWEA